MRTTEEGYLVTLSEMLGRVYDRLTVKPGRSIVAPGQTVAWDDCCNGQLWVRVSSIAPIYQGTTNSVKCPVGYDFTLGIGVIRCVATVDDNGRAPRAETITVDGLRGIRDMTEIADVLQEYRAQDVLTTRLGVWTPAGPDGGCAGGEWSLTMRTGADL